MSVPSISTGWEVGLLFVLFLNHLCGDVVVFVPVFRRFLGLWKIDDDNIISLVWFQKILDAPQTNHKWITASSRRVFRIRFTFQFLACQAEKIYNRKKKNRCQTPVCR